MTWELALVAAAYLLGGFPSALLLVWMATGKDVRREGSGNVGATNATRVGGLWVGALVTAMDVAGRLGFVQISIATVNDTSEQ